MISSSTKIIYKRMQFKTIEQKLNRLCSQHDEYMALLDIIDYLANLKHLNQNNRTTLNRIVQLQQQIQDIQQGQNALRQQQKQLGVVKLEKFKKNIANIEQKLQDYNSTFFQHDLSIKKIQKEKDQFAYHQHINRANTSIEEIIQKETQNLHSAIASFKNQLECKIIEISNTVNHICESRNQKDILIEDQKQSSAQPISNSQCLAVQQHLTVQTLMQTLFKTHLEEFDQLIHEIMLYRIQIPIPPLLPFVQHNFQQIKQKISWLYTKVSIHEQLHNSQFMILQNECQTLHFRIKALKNHVLCELLHSYEKSQRKLEVNRLEKQIGTLIKQLENQLELFNSFLFKAQELRRFRSMQSCTAQRCN